jgi:hypothetical protein
MEAAWLEVPATTIAAGDSVAAREVAFPARPVAVDTGWVAGAHADIGQRATEQARERRRSPALFQKANDLISQQPSRHTRPHGAGETIGAQAS